MNYKNFTRILKYLLILACFKNLEAQTKINALTIMIDFPDQLGFAPIDTVSNALNQVKGYKSFGVNGSVREYWNDVTAGQLIYTSKVIGWYHASKPRNAYETATDGFGELLNEILPKVANTSLTGLTLRPGTQDVYSVNIVVQGAWTNTFRPVATRLNNIRIYNDGKEAFLTEAALSPTYGGDQTDFSISNFAHESGHSVFWWNEYYMWQGRSGDLGNFCLMAESGEGIHKDKNPVPPNAGLRYTSGWIKYIITNLNVSSTQTFTVIANDMKRTLKYTNPNNPREYFLVEAYQKKGRFVGMPDEGLAIWYVDEEGGLKLPAGEKDRYIRVKLMEADGLDQIAKNINVGDANDLFDKAGNSSFSDWTTPNARWKDGSYSGLNITNISAVGPEMTFTVEVNSGVLNAIAGENGKIFPSGTIRNSIGSNVPFNFLPDLGYRVSKITVNGVTTDYSSTSYTFNNISANSTLKVEFQKATSGYELPSPWLAKTIGSTHIQAEINHVIPGTFLTKQYSGDIYGKFDNFQYIYQPLSGDGELSLLVRDQDATSEWAKAGIMIRETLTETSKDAFMYITPWQGAAFQYRTSTGSEAFNSNTQTNKDYFIKLVRKGNLFSGYTSSDGSTWKLYKEATINMATNVFIGMAAVGLSNSVKNATKFQSVKFTQASNLLTKYAVPRTSALPSRDLKFSKVLTIGTGGPNLSNVHNSKYVWNASNNQLTQFSLETTNQIPRSYTGLEGATYSTNTLNQSSPSITLKNTGFPNLDNAYYVNYHGDNVVLVEKTGKFALYFCNCTSVPAREDMAFEEQEIIENTLTTYPNPFNSTITVDLSKLSDPKRLTVFDLAGNLVQDFNIEGKSSLVLGQDYATGLYLVKIEDNRQTSMLKIAKE